jgi:hypothetical protein
LKIYAKTAGNQRKIVTARIAPKLCAERKMVPRRYESSLENSGVRTITGELMIWVGAERRSAPTTGLPNNMLNSYEKSRKLRQFCISQGKVKHPFHHRDHGAHREYGEKPLELCALCVLCGEKLLLFLSNHSLTNTLLTRITRIFTNKPKEN